MAVNDPTKRPDWLDDGNLTDTQRSIISAQSPGYQTAAAPSTVDLSSLYRAIGDLRGTNTDIAVPTAKYQTPEQLVAMQNAMLTALQPQADAQKRTADESFGKSINSLRSQWASRGLLAGNAPAIQEKGLADTLARAQSDIQANAQAEAFNRALQGATLGLSEQGQLWNQAANNRDANLAKLQAAIGALTNAKNMDIGQSQWAQGFAQAGDQFNRQLGENQRQFDIGSAIDLSSLFGTAVNPASSASALFGQVAGKTPWQVSNAAEQLKLDQSRLAIEQDANRRANAAAGSGDGLSATQAKNAAMNHIMNSIAYGKAQGMTYDQAVDWAMQQGLSGLGAAGNNISAMDIYNAVGQLYGKNANNAQAAMIQALLGGGQP